MKLKQRRKIAPLCFE